MFYLCLSMKTIFKHKMFQLFVDYLGYQGRRIIQIFSRWMCRELWHKRRQFEVDWRAIIFILMYRNLIQLLCKTELDLKVYFSFLFSTKYEEQNSDVSCELSRVIETEVKVVSASNCKLPSVNDKIRQFSMRQHDSSEPGIFIQNMCLKN